VKSDVKMINVMREIASFNYSTKLIGAAILLCLTYPTAVSDSGAASCEFKPRQGHSYIVAGRSGTCPL
jgi:hypothetical protein